MRDWIRKIVTVFIFSGLLVANFMLWFEGIIYAKDPAQDPLTLFFVVVLPYNLFMFGLACALILKRGWTLRV